GCECRASCRSLQCVSSWPKPPRAYNVATWEGLGNPDPRRGLRSTWPRTARSPAGSRGCYRHVRQASVARPICSSAWGSLCWLESRQHLLHLILIDVYPGGATIVGPEMGVQGVGDRSLPDVSEPVVLEPHHLTRLGDQQDATVAVTDRAEWLADN